MEKNLTKRFWAALFIFSLMGQVAWVVENMYFNVFLYKMFHASAADISLMVGASSVAATVTTILVGAFSDYVGKRKLFICGGYFVWGISILAFAFIRVDLLTPIAGSALQAASLGVTLVILMDCVMTFFGSSANDASFNAWMTDWGDGSNRGKIEGINSMMPLVAILVVFGGFSAFDLDQAQSWTAIYLIVGIAVMILGIAGIFLIEEKQGRKSREKTSYWENLAYSFRLSVMGENRLLYGVIGAFAIFGISINIFMPYLILYYEKTLGMTNYVVIMAPAIVLAAVITAFYGKLFDLLGFQASVVPALVLLMAGYVFLYFGRATGIVFLGSLLMMTGYLTGMAIFGAMLRSLIPENRSGQFQGIRIIGQVLLPGIIGPAIGAFVLQDAEQILNSDGTTSFLPNENIYLAAFVAAMVTLAALGLLFRMMRHGHYRLVSAWGERLLDRRTQGQEEVVSGCEEPAKKEETVSYWNTYPRPQMRRESYFSLNGDWQMNGKALFVPFPPQSLLSGYQGRVGTKLTYEKAFTLPEKFFPQKAERGHVLLHFGAVDQVAEVFLNGHFVGRHEGGYLPFWFDVTAYLQEGENRLCVKAEDSLSPGYPYGKQRRARGGMWYTPVSGIWQSVWMEAVPRTYIERLAITADMSRVEISLVRGGENHSSAACKKEQGMIVTIKLHDGTLYTIQTQKDTAEIDLSQISLADGKKYQPVLWTVQHPYLYEIEIKTGQDTVSSYFGLRTIHVKQIDGLPKVCLNGEPVFLHGVLDQGYFCDGIFLPAEETEYQRDILRMKELGFNLLRKHIKIEPECFYYYCDLHGMLVMQDMVNSGRYSWIGDTALPTIGLYLKGSGRLGRKGRKDFFRRHMADTIRHLHNHPCVIAYTIFNEGWGQFDSDAMYQKAKELDSTRLYDATSGWFPGKQSDFDSQHIYFKPLRLPDAPLLPVLVSECGGYSYQVPDHFYAKYVRFGYGDCADGTALTQQIAKLYEEIILPAIPKGVCGCIYTQLTDVEDEVNGLYTYDRRVCKVDRKVLQEIRRRLDEAAGLRGF